MPELNQHDQWIEACLSGGLSEAGREAMEQWLLEDDANLDRLARAVIFDVQMREVFLAGRRQNGFAVLSSNAGQVRHNDIQSFDHDIMTELIKQTLAERQRHEIQEAAGRELPFNVADHDSLPVTHAVDLAKEPARDRSPWFSVLSLTSIAAAIAIVAILALVFSFGQSDPVGNGLAGLQPPAEPSDRVLATLIESQGAEWGRFVPPADGVLLGGGLELVDGYAEMQMAGGARVVMQGPISLELIDGNRLALASGKLVAHVPERAHGFTVQTPSTTIVDLGTEFGVDVLSQGQTRVQVYTGMVDLHRPSEPNRLRAMRAGDACVVDAEHVHDVTFDAVSFARHLPSDGQGVVDAGPKTYSDIVRSHDPLVWWSFDELVDGCVVDRGRAVANSRAVDGLRLTPSPMGQAASIDGSCAPISLADDRALPLRTDFTIEAWIRVEAGTDFSARLISTRDLSSAADRSGVGFGFGLAGGKDMRSGYVRRFFDINGQKGQPNALSLKFTAYGVFDVYTEQPISTGRWVHVAAVYADGHPVQMFIDGEPARMLSVVPAGSNLANAKIYQAWVASEAVRASDQSPMIGRNPTGAATSEPFLGDVDELIVYDKALSDEAIHKLYLFGKAGNINLPAKNVPPVVEQ